MPDITFRTNDGSRWGFGKGANLTAVEVDLNFWFLYSNVEMLLTHSPTPTEISGFRVVGSDFYVDMDDHSTFGPFPLPIAAWNFRGEWLPLTDYFQNDVITFNGSTYLVLLDHESEASFDPGANDGHGHDFYGLMMTAPDDVLPALGTTGQRLAKRTNASYDVEWVDDIPGNGLPGHGERDQKLIKQSSTDFDAIWADDLFSTLSDVGLDSALADGDTLVSRSGIWTNISRPFELIIACSDESTALISGTNKTTFRMPATITLTEVRASLTTAQASGTTFNVDINQSGVSILSTTITIDNTEKTSTLATIPPVISNPFLNDDDEITVDIDAIGDGTAKGLKITLIGFRP